jgi:hypothetical protein
MSFLLIIESKKNIMNIKPIIFILYIYNYILPITIPQESNKIFKN